MKFPLCMVALLAGTTIVQAAPLAEPLPPLVVAEPLAEKNGLKVSVGGIELLTTEPHINVVLQNVSTKPIELPAEVSQLPTDGLVLEITKLDGKSLDKKIVVSNKNRFMDLQQQGQIDILAPGEAIVREIYLQVTRNGEVTPTTTSFVSGFPVPNEGGAGRLVTMRVLFTNSKSDATKSLWSGQIASDYKDYNIHWKSGPYINIGPNVAF